MIERLRRRLELRRSNAARPHKSDRDYDRNDKSWQDEYDFFLHMPSPQPGDWLMGPGGIREVTSEDLKREV